ncbi:MAG TPA: CDP-diacylglycerol--glycerol-3-phosphate 3-phosphatidyltransferase [Bryobacteraceae bacterium]|nr:CDP-diacylglycerol--glycerol-3-phosphate 3-phosphatidyltransferase [Bryobacteraceae bacterium]
MNLPNALTILRIFFVPLLVAALVLQNVFVLQVGGVAITNEWLALGIFLAAAGTDLLDGYLARRWQQVTTIGTLLDPIADKLLISAALISLVEIRVLPGWMAILIIGREFAVSGLRSIAAAEGYTIKANDLGKTKMLAEVVAVSVILVSIHHPEFHLTGMLLMWAVVFFAMLSAVSYFRKFWRKVDERVKRRRRRELLTLERRRQKELLRQRGSPGGVLAGDGGVAPEGVAPGAPPAGDGGLGAARIWKPPEVS